MEEPTSARWIIRLPSLADSADKWLGAADRIFFAETSFQPFLPPRSACAVESALRLAQESGLAVVVAMTSETVDLSHNATCRLYRQGAP